MISSKKKSPTLSCYIKPYIHVRQGTSSYELLYQLNSETDFYVNIIASANGKHDTLTCNMTVPEERYASK